MAITLVSDIAGFLLFIDLAAHDEADGYVTEEYKKPPILKENRRPMCEGAYATLILFVRAFITLARTSFTTSGQ
jgi:hypothetical protein